MSDRRLSPWGEEARRADYDRYLLCLLAPASVREDLFVLLAFNAEIARIRDLVREPMMGRIRLQWWRDVLDGLETAGEGGPAVHPLLPLLGAAMSRHRLDRRHFDTLIDAREADLEDQPPSSLAGFIAYAEATSAPLAALFLEVLGATDWPEAGRAAASSAGRHAAIAWALTGLIRSLPFHAVRQRTVLPAELFARHRITPCTARGRGFDPRALTAPVAEVAALARGHLAEARLPAREVPKPARPALLLASLAEFYLTALERAGHDVAAAPVQRQRLAPLWLSWRALVGRY